MGLVLILAASLFPAMADEPVEPFRLESSHSFVGLTGAYGGFVGGSAGYLLTEALDSSDSVVGPAMGSLLGIGVGATTGLLIQSRRPMDGPTTAFATALTTYGGFAGGELARGLIPYNADGAEARIHAARLAGSMLGAGFGMAHRRVPTTQRTLRVSLATAVGWQTGVGINEMAGFKLDERRPRAGIALATATAFGGLAIGSEMAGLERIDPGFTALSLGHGAWIGAMAPLLLTEEPSWSARGGGARAGLGVGYLTGVALSAFAKPSAKSVGLQAAGMSIGNAIGAGLPLALTDETDHPRMVVGPMLATGLVGQVAGAIVAPHYELSDNDAFLLSTMGAWTAYQTAGWTAYAAASSDTPRRPLGYALMAGGVGSALTLAVAPAIEIDASGSISLLSAGGWGTWYGGWASHLGGLSRDEQWLVTLGIGNATLGVSAVALGAGWKPNWRQLGLVNGCGSMGAAAGGLVGVIALYDADNWDPMVVSMLAGSTVGLAAGGWLASRTPVQKQATALRLPELQLGRSRWVPSFSARPWQGEDGGLGGYVELSAREIVR